MKGVVFTGDQPTIGTFMDFGAPCVRVIERAIGLRARRCEGAHTVPEPRSECVAIAVVAVEASQCTARGSWSGPNVLG